MEQDWRVGTKIEDKAPKGTSIYFESFQLPVHGLVWDFEMTFSLVVVFPHTGHGMVVGIHGLRLLRKETLAAVLQQFGVSFSGYLANDERELGHGCGTILWRKK